MKIPVVEGGLAGSLGPAHEPESRTGTLRDAAVRLRLLRLPRLRPQFGISSAVGAALLVARRGRLAFENGR